MSDLGNDGDTSDVTDAELEPRGKPNALETGWYRAKIVDSKYVDNNAGTGKVLHLKMHLRDEPNHMRDFLNLRHPNEVAQSIGRARLKSIAVAVGHDNPNGVADSAMLHNRDLFIHVLKELSVDPKYGDALGFKNRVIDYRAVTQGDIEAVGNPSFSKPTHIKEALGALPF